MANSPEATLQQFLQLFPVVQAIAGLPASEHGKYVNEDQMEIRARLLKTAFLRAQALVNEVAEPTPPAS